MFYWLLYEQLYRVFSPLRVFRFITFRTAFASLTALFLCLVLGPWLIGKLRVFQIGQHIREEGPKSHQKKAGTPTMGGVLIVISIVVPTLLWANLTNAYVWLAMFAILSLRRNRLLGRPLEDSEGDQSRDHRPEEVSGAVPGGGCDRRVPAAVADARGILDGDERAVLQELQAEPGHRRPARKSVHLGSWRSRSSSCLLRSSSWAARMR